MSVYQELKNIQDKQLSYKKAYDHERLKLQSFFDKISYEWGKTKISQGLYSVLLSRFTNLFSIAAKTIC